MWGFAALLGIGGLVIGSFLAALVVRWPQDRSVVSGRSQCDGCGQSLSPAELIPILSFVVARGRCRACGGSIDPIHWQIELLGGAVGAAAAIAAGPSGAGPAVAGAVMGWLLLALAALDLVAFWLPDRLTALLAAAGIAAGSAGVDPPLVDRLIGGASGFAALWMIAAVYRRARNREGLGAGDPKLFGAIGLWLGWRLLPGVLLIAALTGLGVVLVRHLSGRQVRADDRLPFGTLLAVATYPCWLLLIASSS